MRASLDIKVYPVAFAGCVRFEVGGTVEIRELPRTD
jgi:hypothetical protein